MISKKRAKTRIIVIIFFEILFVCLFTVLFYCEAIKYNGIYSSDLPAHISFALDKRGYSFLYSAIRFVYEMTGSVFSIALLESFIWVGTQIMSCVLAKNLCDNLDTIRVWIIGTIPMFLSGIYIPGIYEYFYRQQLITQPYHNITYIGMRFFAVCTMVIFVKMFDNYLEKIEWKSWCLLSLFLFVGIAIKPSFWLGFSFTLLFFLIIDFCKYRFQKREFIHMFCLGAAVLPSVFVLLMQASILYGKSINEGGTEIVAVWGKSFIANGLTNTALKLFCGLAFPLLVLIYNRKKLERIDKFIYTMFFIQLAVAMLFAESGKRNGHGNFYWGVYCAAFFLFVLAIAKFISNIKSDFKTNMFYKVSGSILIVAHILSGLIYLMIVCSGKSFFV